MFLTRPLTIYLFCFMSRLINGMDTFKSIMKHKYKLIAKDFIEVVKMHVI